MTSHIQILGTIPRIRYVANGTTKTFEFPFAIFKEENLDVYIDDTLQSSDNYSISGVNQEDGGSITFETAPQSGKSVSLVRNLTIERTTEFEESNRLRAKDLNDELNYQTACMQQIADNLNRSMILPPYAADTNIQLTLPTPSAGKAIVWNADGSNLENSTVAVNALESTIKGYKTAAETAATTATTKAGIATNAASTATTKAAEATAAMSNKANKDMDNLSTSGKAAVVAFGMPDYSAGVSLGEPSTYQTIPVDSFVRWSSNASGSLSSLGIYLANSDESIVMDFKVTTSYSCNMGIPVPAGWKVKGVEGRETISYFPMKGVSNA